MPPFRVLATAENWPDWPLRPLSAEETDQVHVPMASGENLSFQLAPPSQNRGTVRVPPLGRLKEPVAETSV